MKNIHKKSLSSFGDEWRTFTYELKDSEIIDIFNNYFDVFPKKFLNHDSIGFDLGCGTGRWAKFIAPKVKKLYCIDPSLPALNVAKKKLNHFNNCCFLNQNSNNFSIKKETMDFGYSLGVLHHVPNTKAAVSNCVSKLKKGSPFLLYLYYNLDNRSQNYKFIWQLSNILRLIISRLPFKIKIFFTNLIAYVIYFPWIKFLKFLKYINIKINNLPLSFYIDKSIYIIKNDSLDRFGTPLEKRFSKKQIENLMSESGLEKINFHNKEPYWIAVGYKK
tara:strand:+ start:148 stop:972 length:825 start_codon:yes stop_codon:yes gene_type:complete